MNSASHVRGVVSRVQRPKSSTPIHLVPSEHRLKVIPNERQYAEAVEPSPMMVPTPYYPYAVVPCVVYMPPPVQRMYESRQEGTFYPNGNAQNQMRWDSASFTPMQSQPFSGRRNFATIARENTNTTKQDRIVPNSEGKVKTWGIKGNSPGPTCHFSLDMNLEELYREIMKSFRAHGNCRLSWYHRLLSQVETKYDYERAKTIWNAYVRHNNFISPETSTLIIKAACKAGLPMDGLEVLTALSEHEKYWPSTAGVQYLMISLSLNKQTEAVMKTYELIKKKGFKVTPKTFHIIIRECVDNGLVDEALMFVNEAQEMGVEMNRVAYNILMNGCRKNGLPERVIELRKIMEEHNIEINDSTVKFTALAHIMMANPDEAVKSFREYEKLGITLEEFGNKFFDAAEEEGQQSFVGDLFKAVQDAGIDMPQQVLAKLDAPPPAPQEQTADSIFEKIAE
ncbi:hypothetical protein PROFUN_01146 [Planoprotostelium fungivorum]|uniref:Pentacotripeptide-repeat region of PRORP domain-containing protein n=1 Tax=Planoprotostelium fungivorum TaxID=1890364 RepID=A0A2P6NCG2_9EUKA|nr:hypothetical protein PROFUN_01146 [Planoprotostelium fungivorum]